MNNQAQNNIQPFRQNIILMKQFFSKPIILLTAIFFSLQAIFSFVPIFFKINSFNSSIDLIAMSISVALYIIYFISKNLNDNKFCKAPIIILKILLIFVLVTSSIVIVALCITFSLFLLDHTFFSIFELLFPYMLLFFLIVVSIFVLSISGLKTIQSIKKNLSSIFLYNNGALLSTISTFFIFLFTVITNIMLYSGYNNIMIQSLDKVSQTLSKYNLILEIKDFKNINTFINNSTGIFDIISTSLFLISILLLSIVFYKFYIYIKKIKNNINTTEVMITSNADSNNEHNNVQIPNCNTKVSDFQPQSVFNKSDNTNAKETNVSKVNNNNPYLQ